MWTELATPLLTVFLSASLMARSWLSQYLTIRTSVFFILSVHCHAGAPQCRGPFPYMVSHSVALTDSMIVSGPCPLHKSRTMRCVLAVAKSRAERDRGAKALSCPTTVPCTAVRGPHDSAEVYRMTCLEKDLSCWSLS